MKEEHKTAKDMWKKYLITIGEKIDNTDKIYESWHFCNNEKDADELVEMVKKGLKKATASLYCLYEVENETIAKVGDYAVITNWKGIAQCIVQIKNVSIVPFRDVTVEFAVREGEGDKTLYFWRKVHRKTFVQYLKNYNKKFSENLLVVCEEFKVVCR